MKKRSVYLTILILTVLLCLVAFLLIRGEKTGVGDTEYGETQTTPAEQEIREDELPKENDNDNPQETNEPTEKDPTKEEDPIKKDDIPQEDTPKENEGVKEEPSNETDVSREETSEKGNGPVPDMREDGKQDSEEDVTEKLPLLPFVYADGETLVDEAGNLFRMKGMCFGNNVWENPEVPTLTHHDKESYRELSELGFNTVRFYLNYRMFEDDDTPYVYKETAFSWLEKNIKWAREYNIRLVLNMHVPQGGFMSAKSVQFWSDEENISRYVALWREIAKRYADESVILGYGLMNEPFLPKLGSAEESLNLYFDLIEEVAAEIRKVDKKHIFFVERPYGIVDSEKNVEYVWGDTGSFRPISDSNTVYEFHFYEYTNFTSQGITWSGFERDWYYEDDTIALLAGKRDYCDICKETSLTEYDITSGGWQLIESPIYETKDYKKANAAYAMFYFAQLEKNTTVYVDDIVVKEYDSEGRFLREVYRYSFDSVTECSGWDFGEGTGGKCTYSQEIGHAAAGCEMITDAGGNFRLYKNESMYNYFPIKEGHKYQVTCWVKVEGRKQVEVQPGLQLLEVETVYAMNREFLEQKLCTYVSLGKEYGVPIYIGEFGATSHTMGNEFGGERWVEDVLDILNQYSMNYSYHDYHEENYGLYTTPATKERAERNEALYHVFEEKVKE